MIEFQETDTMSWFEKYRELCVIVKTPKGLEEVAASHIEDVLKGEGEVVAKPGNFPGVVFVLGLDPDECAALIKEQIPEASRVLPVYAVVKANLDEIATKCAEVASSRLSSDETFAIRTTRRGTHPFTSIDVNVVAGRKVQEVTGCDVNLDRPDKAIYVEIFRDLAAISIIPGSEEYRKITPGKPVILPILRKLRIIQMPYTGPLDGVYKMGVRIGRAVQTFEVGELYIAHYRPVSGIELETFLRGLFEGIESRYQIQVRSYGRPVHKVPVYIYDMYQFVREHRNEAIIVTDPKGEYITHVKHELARLFREYPVVNVFIGAREGIPVGIFRFADLVVDLCPQVTIATDYALVSTVIAFISALEEAGALEKFPERPRKKRSQ